MKKIMILAAVAVAAVAANATVVKWNVGNVRIPVAADLAVDQSGIVTTTSNNKFTSGAIEIFLSYQDASENWIGITSKYTTGDGLVGQSTALDQDVDKAVSAVITAAGSDEVNFRITATYNDPTGKGVYSYAGYMTKDISDAASGNSDVSLAWNMNNAGSWDYKANTVDTPEPTSGLLLLLGVAGLALRRRRA